MADSSYVMIRVDPLEMVTKIGANRSDNQRVKLCQGVSPLLPGGTWHTYQLQYQFDKGYVLPLPRGEQKTYMSALTDEI